MVIFEAVFYSRELYCERLHPSRFTGAVDYIDVEMEMETFVCFTRLRSLNMGFSKVNFHIRLVLLEPIISSEIMTVKKVCITRSLNNRVIEHCQGLD